MPDERSAQDAAPARRKPFGKYRICLVCLGNICRSPMAEVLLREEVARAGLAGAVTVESAGTGDWHIGQRMYAGARAELARRGYDGSAHRARQVQRSWLAGYDLVLAMDASNLAELRLTGSQHRWQHYRAVLADGREVFAKVAGADLGGVFAAEAHGLRWLGEAGSAPVPSVLGWDEATLAVSWVPPCRPDAAAAARFGRDLARLHGAGAGGFGAPWPGFIASLSLPNDWHLPPAARHPDAGHGADVPPGRSRAGVTGGGGGDGAGVAGGAGWARVAGGAGAWPDWYAARRVLPYLRRAVDGGVLSAADAAAVEAVLARIAELAGPAEPPSRIHGDLWSGNVLWSGGRGWLIDPAAHGGHRKSTRLN